VLHTIKPITALSREEVAALARNAADNSVPLPSANPFEHGSEQHAWFTHSYWERDWELRAVEA
jgi:hypothetical protein